jgi:hypothetical protein
MQRASSKFITLEQWREKKNKRYFLIWENDFKNWLKSIDIDTSYIDKKRPY